MKNKLNWEQSMMETVKIFEKHSKCAAKQVCCIIANKTNNAYNILSIGLNGTPSGQENCCDKWERHSEFPKKWINKESGEVSNDGHSKWSNINEIHAEINAIAKCNMNGTSIQGASAFISYSPCFNCAKTLVAFGIKEIYYENEYDDFNIVAEFLISNGIKLQQIKL